MEISEFNLTRYSGRTVREMHSDEQPREKLLRYGAESLSDAELMAIILRTGSRTLNVVDMSRALITHFRGLRNLSRQSWQSLLVIPGVAQVKAITLQAVFELSKRLQVASLGDELKITSPDLAAAYFIPKLRDLTHEEFYVGFLNNSKVLTGYKRISSGGSTATIVEPAEVLRQAILHQANSLLLVHNHPSGQLKESSADLLLTKRIAESGRMLGIPVTDHIIVAGNHFLSFKEKNLI